MRDGRTTNERTNERTREDRATQPMEAGCLSFAISIVYLTYFENSEKIPSVEIPVWINLKTKYDETKSNLKRQ